MAYCSLLAHLRNEPTSKTMLDVAVSVAERHRAHLTGLHVIPPPDIYMAHPMSVAMSEQLTREQQAIAIRLGDLFQTRLAASDIASDWCVDENPGLSVEQGLVELASTADLVVVGLAVDPVDRGSRGQVNTRVLTGSGRPVLLVPPDCRCTITGSRVFVAWDGERASTRAVFDALPMLHLADSVRLQRVNPPRQDRHRTLGVVDRLASTLSRHDVNVEVFNADSRITEIGEDLLGFATDWGADLIVMGGYGHNAVRGFLLGSSTGYVLEHARIPVLMSN